MSFFSMNFSVCKPFVVLSEKALTLKGVLMALLDCAALALNGATNFPLLAVWDD